MEHCVTRTTTLHLTLYLLSSVRTVVYRDNISYYTAKYVKMLNIHILLRFLVVPLWCMVICFNVLHLSLVAIVLQFNLNVSGRLRNCYLDLIVSNCCINKSTFYVIYHKLYPLSAIKLDYNMPDICRSFMI